MTRTSINLVSRLAPGAAIGRFIVGPWLASGGTADIYMCYPASEAGDTSPPGDYQYVVKLFRFQGDLEQYDRRVRLFEKEVQTLRSLAGNIHIVNVLEHGEYAPSEEDWPRPFCVLPRMTGGTLTSLVHSQSLSSYQTISITLGLVDALQYAHQRAILHCDIKPDNVMLDESLNPVWIDFGIAKEIDTRTDVVSVMSEVGNVAVGTAPYMSPEHFAGRHALCPQSDLWSMGVLMIRMLTRVYPFGMHFEQVRQRTILQRWQSLDQLPAFKESGLPVEIPDGLQAVIYKCLQVELEDRYQTALELKEDLLALQQNRVPSYAMPAEASEAEVESMTMEVVMPTASDDLPVLPPSQERSSRLKRWLGIGVLVVASSLSSAFLFNWLSSRATQDLTAQNLQQNQPNSDANTSPPSPDTKLGNPSTSNGTTGTLPANGASSTPFTGGASIQTNPTIIKPTPASTNPALSTSPPAGAPPASVGRSIQVQFVPTADFDPDKAQVVSQKEGELFNVQNALSIPYSIQSGQTISYKFVSNETGEIYQNRITIPAGFAKNKLRINWKTGSVQEIN